MILVQFYVLLGENNKPDYSQHLHVLFIEPPSQVTHASNINYQL